MNYLRFLIAFAVAKIIQRGLMLLGRSGTALPGLIASKIAPSFLQSTQRKLGRVVLITGTNGKTTTQNFLTQLLASLTNQTVLSNRSGSNMVRGLISEFCEQCSWRKFLCGKFAFTVFEVEEATLPRIANSLKPEMIIVTNFFRDQLDAYGEVTRTVDHVRRAILAVPNTQVVGNGDDPVTRALLAEFPDRSLAISVPKLANDFSYEQTGTTRENEDATNSRSINQQIFPKPEITANLGTQFKLQDTEFRLNLPGYYSYYSACLSFASLEQLLSQNSIAVDIEELANIASRIKPAFGRGEEISNPELQLFLVKNPAGFNAVLDLLANAGAKLNLVILINDNIADGRDVSWLWDAELEKLDKIDFGKIYCGGERALDMQLRLKYANRDYLEKISVIQNYTKLLDVIKTGGDKNVKVLATYTALNELRSALGFVHSRD